MLPYCLCKIFIFQIYSKNRHSQSGRPIFHNILVNHYLKFKIHGWGNKHLEHKFNSYFARQQVKKKFNRPHITGDFDNKQKPLLTSNYDCGLNSIPSNGTHNQNIHLSANQKSPLEGLNSHKNLRFKFMCFGN